MTITDKVGTDYSFVNQTTKIEDKVTELEENPVPFIPETVP